MSKTPEELAQQYISTIADTHSVKAACEKAFIAGYKAGREMSEKEIFDLYVELRKQHGEKEPDAKPLIEKFKLTYIEKKGFF
jgi:hypothetical protein